MTSHLLSDLHFNLNLLLISADDWYIQILKNKLKDSQMNLKIQEY
jgi:hypothetical protein